VSEVGLGHTMQTKQRPPMRDRRMLVSGVGLGRGGGGFSRFLRIKARSSRRQTLCRGMDVGHGMACPPLASQLGGRLVMGQVLAWVNGKDERVYTCGGHIGVMVIRTLNRNACGLAFHRIFRGGCLGKRCSDEGQDEGC
jgi:hypothetical protein